jgi:hypothetical protein
LLRPFTHWASASLFRPQGALGFDLASLGQVRRGAFLRNQVIARKFLLLTTLPLRFRLRRMPHWGTAQLRASTMSKKVKVSQIAQETMSFLSFVCLFWYILY